MASSETYNLQQCIDAALKGNVEVRKQQNSVSSARLQYKQSQAAFSPSVGGTVGQNWNFGRSTGVDNVTRAINQSNTSFNINVSLVLWDGLANKFYLDQTRTEKYLTEAQLETVKLQIKLNICTMYLQVLLNKELLKVAENQLSDTRKKLRRDSVLIAANRLSEGETYALRAQATKEELAVVQAHCEELLSLLDLAQAMEQDDYTDFDIVVPEVDELGGALLQDKEMVYQTALANRPEIKVCEYTIIANEAALKANKAAYSPTLSVGAGVGTSYYHIYGCENKSFESQMGDNFAANVDLSLTIPIYDKLSTPTRIKRQKVTIENAKLDLENEKKTIRKEIEQAFYNAQSAQMQQLSARESELSALEAFRYAEQRYNADRMSTYEYIESKNALLQAQSVRIQAQYNYLFRIRILEYYQGRL